MYLAFYMYYLVVLRIKVQRPRQWRLNALPKVSQLEVGEQGSRSLRPAPGPGPPAPRLPGARVSSLAFTSRLFFPPRGTECLFLVSQTQIDAELMGQINNTF